MRPGGVDYGDLVPGLALPDPTQIAFDGKRLLIVSNAGWEAAAKPNAKRSHGAPILAIPLSQGVQAGLIGFWPVTGVAALTALS